LHANKVITAVWGNCSGWWFITAS